MTVGTGVGGIQKRHRRDRPNGDRCGLLGISPLLRPADRDDRKAHRELLAVTERLSDHQLQRRLPNLRDGHHVDIPFGWRPVANSWAGGAHDGYGR